MTDRLLLAQISVDIRDLQKQMQKAGFSVETTGRRMAQNWKATTSGMARDTEQFGRDVRRAIAGIALATVTSEVTDLADAWTRASNQISAAAAATGGASVSLSAIADIARGTRVEFEATATLYARLTRATADLGASQEQVIEATRLINQSFVAGGASAQEQASAILQLSQALSSGVLQGDELRSLRESSPLLLQAIAKEFGVAQGALKALGAEGKLTSDRIFKAILNAAPEIEAQFSVTQATVADSFTNLRTAAIEYTGTLNQSLGATDAVGGAVNALADNFESFADALLISVALLGARGLGGALNAAAGNMISYVATMNKRRGELIKGLIAERDQTLANARAAAKAVENESNLLARVTKEREAANAAIFTSDKSIIQSRQLAAAQADVAKSTEALNKQLTAKVLNQNAVDEAQRRLTLSQANLNALQKSHTVDVARLNNLDAQSEAITNRLTEAKNRLAAAQASAARASAALAAAQQGLARAGASVLNFFGGPIGLALVGVTAAMGYFQFQTVRAERAVTAVNSALSILAEGYGVTEGLARDAAGASAELTAQLNAQKDAAAALAEIEKQTRRDDYIKGLEGARERAEKLADEVRKLENADFLWINTFAGGSEKAAARLGEARKELEGMTRYVGILEAGLAGLEAIGFAKPEVSADLPGAPSGGGSETESESEIEARLKAEQSARERAAEEAERLIEGLRATWRGYYEFRGEAIERELSEDLAAIDKAALSAEAAAEARTLAEQSAAAKRRELAAEEAEEAEEAARLKEEAAQREIDLVARVMDERDRMLGRTLSIISREFDARRAAIEEEIQDETRRNEALRALATEEAEFRRQAAEGLRGLDDRSDGASEIARVQEITKAKLDALQEGYDLELIQLQEFEELKREIIADSEAEIMAIRQASALSLLSGAQQLFGALSSLASTFAGEQSGIFKALFLAEKAAALASAYINMQLAIAKANASAAAPLNAPAILAAKVTGAAAIAGILASTAAGFKKGGYTGDGDPNTVAGAVHRGEYVFDAKATKRLGIANLEALRSGRMPSTIAGAVAPAPARSVSFGDMIVSVSGNGAAEIRDELAAALDQHRRTILSDVDRNFGSMQAREIKRTTPRFERPRP